MNLKDFRAFVIIHKLGIKLGKELTEKQRTPVGRNNARKSTAKRIC